MNPSAPANKFVSASTNYNAATPVVAYNDPFVVVSRFAVFVRLYAVLPAKYDTDDRLLFVVNSKFLVLLRSVTVVPSKKETDDKLLFVNPNNVQLEIQHHFHHQTLTSIQNP